MSGNIEIQIDYSLCIKEASGGVERVCIMVFVGYESLYPWQIFRVTSQIKYVASSSFSLFFAERFSLLNWGGDGVWCCCDETTLSLLRSLDKVGWTTSERFSTRAPEPATWRCE